MLTPTELARLKQRGVIVTREVGEKATVWHNGQRQQMDMIELQAMARPHLKQRIAQWFTGRDNS